MGELENQGGHYVTYTRTSFGTWVMYNDLKVAKVDVAKVLTSQVYLMSYTKRH